MDTEQYEEAVRDYEKVYQTEKTSGKLWFYLTMQYILTGQVWHTHKAWLSFYSSRSQAPAEDGTARAEEEQEERLLQGAWGWQKRHRGWDKKGLSQTGPYAPPRQALLVFTQAYFYYVWSLSI